MLFSDACLSKTFGYVRSQLVHVELGSVDDDVGQLSNACQMTALGLDGGVDWRIRTQGMGSASLTEAAHEHGIGRFEKSDFGGDHAADRLQDAGKLLEFRSLANVDN